jgi:hypothetical protein
MKKLFLMLAAAAAVASCSKDYTIVADQGEAIEFGSFVENSTRANAATDPSYSTTAGKGVALTQFNVYGAVGGVNIFNGNLVTKGGDDVDYGEAWTLTGATQYWINGANYEFVAVVDGNKKVGENVITKTTLFDTTGIPNFITYNSDGATDLLCKRVERNAVDGNTDTSLVGFQFTHLLSKVMFSVKNNTNAAATNYRIVLTEAKITGALANSTYVVSTGLWNNDLNPTTKDFTLENLIINSDDQQYHSTELLLLPGVNVGVYVKAEIQATANGTNWTKVSTMEKTFTNVLGADKTLVANQAYHFAVTLGIGTEIQFTATAMPEWTDGDGDDDTPLQ